MQNSNSILSRFSGVQFLTIFTGLMLICHSGNVYGQFAMAQPQWIWDSANPDSIPNGTCHFRKTLEMTNVESASIHVAAYDEFKLYVNGKRVGTGNKSGTLFDIADFIEDGKNTVAVQVDKSGNENAGLWARITIKPESGRPQVHVTDGTWKTSTRPLPLWQRRFYSASNWKYARSLGPPPARVRNKAIAENATTAPVVQKSDLPQYVSAQDAASINVSDKGITRLAVRKIDSNSLKSPDFRVPRQFEVQHVASDADVGSVIAMEFNEFGQIVVSTEGGSLQLVYDSNKDGSFDSVRKCCETVRNVQGIAAISGDLFVTGEGPNGNALYRLTDDDQDGFYERATKILKIEGTPGEHGAHSVVLGPDGYVYALIGNHASVQSSVDDSSPYKHPYSGDLVQRFEDPGGHANGIKAPGGTIVRVDPSTSRTEIVAGGLRNPYDIAFDKNGQLFTHDSDMESDEGTTWYRPTRVLHVVPGADLGWRSGWSKWHDYYIDTLPAITHTGRGSPAGLAFYQHDTYPEKYRDTLFSCDWAGGQILVMRCDPDGAGYKAAFTTFLKGEPLNATDLSVGPDGWIYFSTGGRGTQGSIFRVVWTGTSRATTPVKSDVDQVLRQPQLLSAWARQEIARIKQKTGKRWQQDLTSAILDSNRPSAERVQGLTILHLFGLLPSTDVLAKASRDPSAEVRAKAASLMALATSPSHSTRLIQMLEDPDPAVRREVCLALARAHVPITVNQISHILAAEDRFESLAARRLLETIPVESWESFVLKADDHRVFLQGATAMMVASPSEQRGRQVIGRAIHILQDYINDRDFLDLLRVLQLTLHRTGLKASDVPDLAFNMAEEYPSSHTKMNRELVRLLAYLQVDSIMDRYIEELERDDVDTSERIHLAMHLTLINGGWNTSDKLKVFKHLDPPNGAGNSVPGYLQNASVAFGKTLTDEEATLAIAQGHEYRSAAMAAILRLPEKLSDDQIKQLIDLDQRLVNSNTDGAKRLKIAIVAVLSRDGSQQASQHLKNMYDQDESRRVAIAFGLAENINPDNWEYIVRSLPLLDPDATREMLVKLKTVTKWPKEPEPYRVVIKAAERLSDNGASDAIALLEHWQGFASSQKKLPWRKAILAWKKWYAEKFPDALPIYSEESMLVSTSKSMSLTKIDGRWDYAQLQAFVQSSAIANGSVKNGEAAFVKADCAKCHRFGSIGDSLGPDLTGLSKRFRTSEILESIVEPSKIISEQYASKTVITDAGISHSGIVAAGAPGETVVLKSDGRKVRIPTSEIDEIVPQTVSVMPDHLLDRLSAEEVRDLFAFLTEGKLRVSSKSVRALIGEKAKKR